MFDKTQFPFHHLDDIPALRDELIERNDASGSTNISTRGVLRGITFCPDYNENRKRNNFGDQYQVFVTPADLTGNPTLLRAFILLDSTKSSEDILSLLKSLENRAEVDIFGSYCYVNPVEGFNQRGLFQPHGIVLGKNEIEFHSYRS